MIKIKRLALAFVLFISVSAVSAQDLFMVRSKISFPETMLVLQNAITEQGYTVSRVQRVDIGLTKMGYKTDKYRIVFFGKLKEIEQLSKNHPELVPYLPIQISIFAENGQTLLVSANPQFLAKLYPDPELSNIFTRWEKDLHIILDKVLLE